ncbi:MAG: hydroxyacid dehydrogenase, partial [Rhodothermia bacterium]
MKILIADKFSESAIASMRAEGHEVIVDPSLAGARLRDVLETEKPQALVVRSTNVSADMMDANPDLELIVRAGAGYDTIDVDGASKSGIYVANCPGKNA